ncbi:MAG: hypothetical protein H7333_03080, partial [Bdellovibrionales bacterium]|nr:hypothetical protein [Oligoflexia bacterium]
MKSLYPKSVVVLASILSFNGCGKNLHVNLPSNQNAIRANTFATPLISGKDGMSGSKILFGIQNPTVTDGSFGDMYMNTRTGDIFSLEMSGWVLKGNVKGPKGDTGEKGAQGEVGKAGLDGVPGTSASNKILGGTSAPDDKKGMAGDLYVNQTTTELFQKSPDDKWALLFKMKGDRGDGGQASPGMYYGSGKPTGEVTPVGASYLDVGSGDVFTRLPDGSYQKMFHVGGAAANGKDGSQILDGVGAPDPKSGVAGDYYFEDLSSDLYRKEADGQWKLRMTLHPQPVPVQAISPVD